MGGSTKRRRKGDKGTNEKEEETEEKPLTLVRTEAGEQRVMTRTKRQKTR